MRLKDPSARAVYRTAVDFLQAHHIVDADSDAKVLVSHVLNTDIRAVLIDPSRVFSAGECSRLRRCLKRRIAGEPVQYITRSWEFFGLLFYVDPRVLIPRPETELLVEKALEYADKIDTRDVLDLGTGSGCIAIVLKTQRPDLAVTASDISPAALRVARQNARTHRADLRLIHSDLFEHITGAYDIIVSNPPYINQREYMLLDQKIAAYEPRAALFGGEDGLDIIRRIVRSAGRHLKKNGCLMLEIGYDQREAAAGLFQSNGFYDIKTFSDYAGFDRIVVGNYSRIDGE